MAEPTAALISLHRRFSDAIFEGRKTIELRTRRANLAPGSLLLIYVTAPEARLEGWAVVDFVVTADPEDIWRRFGPRTALSKHEFDVYASERETMSAIGIANVGKFERKRSLEALRRRPDGFHPPQFMTFLDAKRFKSLSGLEARALTNAFPAAAE
jgi:predicted transcriptional regulator